MDEYPWNNESTLLDQVEILLYSAFLLDLTFLKAEWVDTMPAEADFD